MRQHKVSLWSKQCPEKSLEPCRDVLFSIDNSGKIPSLKVTQGKMVTILGAVGKGRSRYV